MSASFFNCRQPLPIVTDWGLGIIVISFVMIFFNLLGSDYMLLNNPVVIQFIFPCFSVPKRYCRNASMIRVKSSVCFDNPHLTADTLMRRKVSKHRPSFRFVFLDSSLLVEENHVHDVKLGGEGFFCSVYTVRIQDSDWR